MKGTSKLALLCAILVFNGCMCTPVDNLKTRKQTLINELERILRQYEEENVVSEATCEILTAPGTITSPNFGQGSYGDNLYECWVVQAPEGQVPRVTFESLEIEAEFECGFDSLELFDTDSPSNDNLIETICGATAPSPITGNEQAMTLIFSTDESIGHAGFQLTVNFELKTYERHSESVDPTYGECGVPGPLIGSRIVGGSFATKNQWPWQVSIQRLGWGGPGQFGHYCGGSIVHPRWIITAAHCVKDNDLAVSASQYRVMVGEHERNAVDIGEEIFNIEQIIPHSEYLRMTVTHDVALIRLARDITYTRPYTVPVCLPGANVQDPAPGTVLTATGWGATDNFLGNTGDNNRLMQVDLPLYDWNVCRNLGRTYRRVDSTMMCAGYPDGIKGVCSGDSGGPLVARLGNNGAYYLYGISSWVGSIPCGKPNEPCVFAKVTDFRSWIETTSNYEIPLA